MKDYEILRNYCRRIFLMLNGNMWDDKHEIGNDQNIIYRVCSALLYMIYMAMILMEILAAVIGEFPTELKIDSITFSVSHSIILFKVMSVAAKKKFIRDLNRRVISVCEEHEEEEVMRQKYKAIRINVFTYASLVYGCCLFYTVEGIRKTFSGNHFVSIVTYYPTYENDTMLATSVRIVTAFLFWALMTTMIISAEAFIMAYIIIFKYKFITLRNYFQNLRNEVEKLHNSGENDQAAEKLANGLVEGIKMHSTLLTLSKEIDIAFGIVLALQIFQSSGSSVFLLLQIAISDDLQIAIVGKILCFVFGLFFLLAQFLCNAGEITYQAALIAEDIYYCGWSLCLSGLKKVPNRNIRQLVLQTMIQAQQPLIMKAFKMLDLNYEMFLMVVRATYSIFALFYAQKK